MKKFRIGIWALTLILCFSLVSPSLAYTIKRGDTPYKVFGTNWAEAMQHYFGHSNPYRLPVNAIVDPNGWNQTLGGFSNPTSGSSGSPVAVSETKLADTSTFVATTTVMVNGGFESTPFDTDWVVATNETDATTTVTSTANTGSQAFELDIINTNPDVGLLTQGMTGTAGRDLTVSFSARLGENTSASATLSFILVDTDTLSFGDPLSGFTQCFDKTSPPGTLVSATSTASANFSNCIFTIDNLSTSTYSDITLSDYYTGMQMPASGQLSYILFFGGNTGDTFLLDDFVADEKAGTIVTPADPITPNLFLNHSDYSLIDSGDSGCLFRVDGGTTSTCMLGFDGESSLIFNRNQTCLKFDPFTFATSTATCL